MADLLGGGGTDVVAGGDGSVYGTLMVSVHVKLQQLT